MKISTLFPPAAAVLLLFSSAVIQSATACGISWSPTVEDALRGAVLTQRLAVVVFTGSDWSAGSLKLDRDVLMNPEFGDFFVDSFVLVNADFPQRLEIPAPQLEENTRVATAHRITKWPTLLALRPDGTEYARLEYQGETAEEALRVVKKWREAFPGRESVKPLQ